MVEGDRILRVPRVSHCLARVDKLRTQHLKGGIAVVRRDGGELIHAVGHVCRDEGVGEVQGSLVGLADAGRHDVIHRVVGPDRVQTLAIVVVEDLVATGAALGPEDERAAAVERKAREVEPIGADLLEHQNVRVGRAAGGNPPRPLEAPLCVVPGVRIAVQELRGGTIVLVGE